VTSLLRRCGTLLSMIRLTFASGSEYVGRDASHVLRLLAKAQWTKDARADVKRAIAWRYHLVDGSDPLSIHEWMDDDAFVTAMHDLGIANVERGSSENHTE